MCTMQGACQPTQAGRAVGAESNASRQNWNPPVHFAPFVALGVQAGRAGRREQASMSIYVAWDGPLDQASLTTQSKPACNIPAPSQLFCSLKAACTQLRGRRTTKLCTWYTVRSISNALRLLTQSLVRCACCAMCSTSCSTTPTSPSPRCACSRTVQCAAHAAPAVQYFMHHPDRLFSRPIEKAQLDPRNPGVLEGHLACAAAEAPLLLPDDEPYFGEGLQEVAAGEANEGFFCGKKGGGFCRRWRRVRRTRVLCGKGGCSAGGGGG